MFAERGDRQKITKGDISKYASESKETDQIWPAGLPQTLKEKSSFSRNLSVLTGKTQQIYHKVIDLQTFVS